MIRCQNCGEEVGDGVAFCPHCGKPVGGEGESAREVEARESVEAARVTTARETAPQSNPSNVVAMSSFERSREEGDKSRRFIFIVVGLAAAVLVAGLAYVASRPAAAPGEERLEGAVRPGSPDFPGPDKLVVEFDPNENAEIGPTALGPWAVTFKPVVRNFTGRTVSGLEFHIAGVDPKGQTIRERIAINGDEIGPNRVARPGLSVNFPQDNKPADLKLELTGVRFK
ncbi:MAG TPA: zinc ribbon domain-containing protein [Pyrinomonadaceae bacterium]|nr:zinc ribbon domain-containing protein [Pyrinomonadaceae bacterium]